MGKHLLSDDDPPVKALVIYGANPMSSNPDQHARPRRPEREDLFTVVIEQFPTDTVDYADIVLPATMQTEHLDVNDGYGHMYVHLNRPAVAPAGEALSTTETFRRLAARDGASRSRRCTTTTRRSRARCSATPTTSASTSRAGCGSTTRRPYVPFTEGFPTPSRQARVLQRDGARGRPRPAPRLRPARPVRRPPARADRARQPLVPELDVRQQAGPDEEGRRPADRAAPRRRGSREQLSTGDRARVFNARGSFEAEVEVSDRVRPGVIASTKGHWLKHVRGGANVNATVEERDADMAGGAIFHDNRVEVREG